MNLGFFFMNWFTSWSDVDFTEVNQLDVNAFALTAINTFVIDENGNVWYTDNFDEWVDAEITANAIAPSPLGDYLVYTDGSDDIYLLDVAAATSTQLGTETASIVTTNVNLDVYIITTSGTLKSYDSVGDSWDVVAFTPGTSPQKLSIDSLGQPWVVDGEGDLYYRSNDDDTWYLALEFYNEDPDVTITANEDNFNVNDVSVTFEGAIWITAELTDDEGNTMNLPMQLKPFTTDWVDVGNEGTGVTASNIFRVGMWQDVDDMPVISKLWLFGSIMGGVIDGMITSA